MKSCSAGTREVRIVGWQKPDRNPTNFLVLHATILLSLNPSRATTMLRGEGERKGLKHIQE